MSDLSNLLPDVESSGVYEFIEEINMCIDTLPFESIADIYAGQANAERFIGTTSITAESMIDMLRQDIRENTNGAKIYTYTIQVNFAKGSIRDIIVITVTVFDEQNNAIPLTKEIR
jgi:hypothetical protein